MSQFKFKTTLVRGLALGIPIAVIFVCFCTNSCCLRKINQSCGRKNRHRTPSGRGNANGPCALSAILLFILLLGFLTRIRRVENLRTEMEALVLKFIPSLYQLKAMADDKLELQNAKDTWKPVILLHENKYYAAFIIEEDSELITLLVSKTVMRSETEILVTKKSDVKTIPVNFMDLQKCSKAFGKGFISLINCGGGAEGTPSSDVQRTGTETKINVAMNGGT